MPRSSGLSVILHFSENHHVGNHLRGVQFSTRENVLPDAVELMPIARRCPVHGGGGQELLVVLETVVLRVEEILAVQLHKSEQTDEQIHWLMLNVE